jgi:hypothetical protein
MNSPLTDHDTKLLSKFKQLITENISAVDFLFLEYFGSTFDRTSLTPLHTINREWGTDEYSFANPGLDRVWQRFKDATTQFLNKINSCAIPKTKNTTLYYFGERNDETEDLIEANAQEVNDLARTWCEAYNHFTRSHMAVMDGRQIPPPNPLRINTSNEKEIMSLTHPLDKDAHEDWNGRFCADDFLPLIKLSMPKYRDEYQVIAWEKRKRCKDSQTSVYDLTLYVAEGNNAKVRTYGKSDTLYKISFSYAVFLGTDITVERIFKSKVEGRRIGNKPDDFEQFICSTEENVIVRPITQGERVKLQQLLPDYFHDVSPSDNQKARLKTTVLFLTRPCRVMTCEETTMKYSHALQNYQKIKECGKFFNCPLAQWEGNRHICVGIRSYHFKGHKEKTYHFTLLLTSHPPIYFNRVALVFSILVPDQDEESFVYSDGALARPSLFNGKDKVRDSMGKEWTVLGWYVRDDLEKEENAFFDDYFLSLENNNASAASEPKPETDLPTTAEQPELVKPCNICGWIHTEDCSRWEHPKTRAVETTSKKRAKLLLKLHAGMVKDGGDTAIENFVENQDQKAGYQAADVLGDKLHSLLYFSTKRGRGRIRKPDEKAPKGRPKKKTK